MGNNPFFNLKIPSPTVTVLYLPSIPQSTGHETTQPKDQPAVQASFPHPLCRNSALLSIPAWHVFCLHCVDVMTSYIKQQTFIFFYFFFNANLPSNQKMNWVNICYVMLFFMMLPAPAVTLRGGWHTFWQFALEQNLLNPLRSLWLSHSVHFWLQCPGSLVQLRDMSTISKSKQRPSAKWGMGFCAIFYDGISKRKEKDMRRHESQWFTGLTETFNWFLLEFGFCFFFCFFKLFIYIFILEFGAMLDF